MATPRPVTDDQIRQLSRGALAASQHKDCSIALTGRPRLVLGGRTLIMRKPTKADRMAARVRCASLIAGRA